MPSEGAICAWSNSSVALILNQLPFANVDCYYTFLGAFIT